MNIKEAAEKYVEDNGYDSGFVAGAVWASKRIFKEPVAHVDNTGSTKLLDELRQLCDLAKHLTSKNRLRCYEIIEQLRAPRPESGA